MGTILAFGDSNTHGWHEEGRFPRGVRWPGALEALLPAGWRVIEEGLPGRTAAESAPSFEECLRSHVPLDVVVLFLGVDDRAHGRTPQQIADDLRRLKQVMEAGDLPALL